MANAVEDNTPNDEYVEDQNDGENETENENENNENGSVAADEAEMLDRLTEEIAKAGKTQPQTVRKRLQVSRGKVKAATKMQVREEINEFFEGREKAPEHYIYTPEGNLQRVDVEGKPNTVIRMDKRFVKTTPAEYEEYAGERQSKLREYEEAYELALQTLRIALEAYNADKEESTARSVVLANEAVGKASQMISKTAYPEKWTTILESVTTKDVLMNYDKNEKRKLGYPVYLFKHYDLSGTKAWGTYQSVGSEENVEQEGGGLRIRFITDVEDKTTGHFHPFHIRNFVYNETEYCSPYQAYQAERFKELGLEDLRKQVLGTRSGRTMHVISLKDTTLPKTPQALWEDILFHYFHQNADLAKELEATGSDKFHVMDKQIPAEYGPALDVARTRLRELGDTEVSDQQVKEKTITEEQQKKDKVGAIIHNKFRKKF